MNTAEQAAKSLVGKVAVITGSGSGLGRELARSCARRRMRLVLADVDETGMAETSRIVEGDVPGVEALIQRTDVSELEQVEALAMLSQARFGAVHVLFNNAGVAVGGPLWENSRADWEWVLGVNLYGVIWGVKVFVPLMLAQGEGHVVNVASAAGWIHAPGTGVYNVSKSGVVALSETLAWDLAVAGGKVGVTVLSPAFFPTQIHSSGRNRPAELADPAPMSDARRAHEEQMRYAVLHGRISAADIAEQTLAAVEEGRFHVFPHQRIKQHILARAQGVQDGMKPYDSLAG